MAFKRRFTDPVPQAKEKAFADAGIVAFHGTARFVSADALEVDGELLEADHFVIAAGSKPVPLPIEGAELVASSEDFLNLDTLPRSIVLVGGGYIAMEFAHLAVRASAEVTMLQRGCACWAASIPIWWICWSSAPTTCRSMSVPVPP